MSRWIWKISCAISLSCSYCLQSSRLMNRDCQPTTQQVRSIITSISLLEIRRSLYFLRSAHLMKRLSISITISNVRLDGWIGQMATPRTRSAAVETALVVWLGGDKSRRRPEACPADSRVQATLRKHTPVTSPQGQSPSGIAEPWHIAFAQRRRHQ